MGSAEEIAHFAGLLRGLKRRSGRSYEDLSRRSLTSRSALHRYCSGQVVPPNVETVARIADACGADDHDRRALVAAWLAATEDRTAGAPAPDPPEPEPQEETPPRPPEPAVRTGGPGPRRTGLSRRAVAAAIAVACAAGIASPGSTASVPDPRTAASPPGWVWTTHPRPVPSESYGVTINSDTGMLPTFKVGSVRFWDSGTRWASLEPRRGEFDWTTLDRQIGAAERRGLDSLFVIGGTPAWAAPAAPAMAYADGSRAAGPDDLRLWDRFVTALAERYRGRIDAYEIWPLGNDPRFFARGPERLVELTRRASAAIRPADPEATVVCPGMGRLWDRHGRDYLRRFAELGGYRHCDAAGVKLHQRRATDPPETMLEPLRAADRAMHAAGVHPPLWSTGTTYDIPLQRRLNEAKAADHAMRFYLTGILGSELYLRRMYFYNWGSTRIPVVLQEPGSAPTRAALAVERLQRWLAHARVRSCGHGTPAGLPANVWQCEFVHSEPAGQGTIIRWTDTGTADTPAPPGTTAVETATGATRPIREGELVPVTESPLRFRLRTAPGFTASAHH
ncbi:helix-turn-helix transcriptional regulator [Spirillospora sp. NPDC029432]|uniref:helix-turn-helix transcriptional regulator n=1 Tax=Spirillospora sp. NPDC029432 TaxID=3154599 RepID=UPI003454EFB8